MKFTHLLAVGTLSIGLGCSDGQNPAEPFPQPDPEVSRQIIRLPPPQIYEVESVSRYHRLLEIAESRVDLKLSIIDLILQEHMLRKVSIQREELHERIIDGVLWPHEDMDFEIRKMQNQERSLRERQDELSRLVESARTKLDARLQFEIIAGSN